MDGHRLVLMLVLTALSASCSNSHDPEGAATTSDSKKLRAEPVAAATAKPAPERNATPVRVPHATPLDLVLSYERNEVAADKTYGGEMYEVTGIVKKIKKGLDGKMIVALRVQDAFKTIDCSLNDQFADHVAGLVPGQLISVHGIVDGLRASSIRLANASLVWTSAPPESDGQPPSKRALGEAQVIAASMQSCFGEEFKRVMKEGSREVVEKVLRESGVVDSEKRQAAQQEARDALEGRFASDEGRTILARLGAMKKVGIAELSRLKVSGLPCAHPSIPLMYACLADKERSTSIECKSQPMQLASERYQVLQEKVPATPPT